MGTMRFVLFFIVGLAAIVVDRVPLAVAQAPCTAGGNATGSATAPALATNMTMMVAPGVPELKNWDDAAVKGCVDLKSLITPGNAKLLGFDTAQDASLAQIGTPFNMYTIGIDKLRDYFPGNLVAPLVKRLDSRLYPLSVGGEVRSALVVSWHKSNNELVTTTWGLVKLIQLVTKYRKADSDFIVWVPALNFHFLGNVADERLMLTPLATRNSYGLIEGVPVPAAVVFALLAQQARAHDENNPG